MEEEEEHAAHAYAQPSSFIIIIIIHHHCHCQQLSGISIRIRISVSISISCLPEGNCHQYQYRGEILLSLLLLPPLELVVQLQVLIVRKIIMIAIVTVEASG